MWKISILMYAIAAIDIYYVFRKKEKKAIILVLWAAALILITLYSFFSNTPKILDLFFENQLT